MKKSYVVLLLAFCSIAVFSQEKYAGTRENRSGSNEVRTIFGPHRGNGGYGALSFGYTEIDGRGALLMGGRGEWVVGHGFGLGIGGYGFINEPEYSAPDDLYYNLSGGYGGFFMEPIIMGKWPVHISLPMLLGVGAVARTSFSEDVFAQSEPYDVYLEEASLFLVAEPGAELEFNLLRWMRLSFFGSYRFTTTINMIDVDPSALVGWNAGITLKIGIF